MLRFRRSLTRLERESRIAFGDDVKTRLEIERSIAQRLVFVATDHDGEEGVDPDAAFSKMLRLGFPDLNSKSSNVICFAKWLLEKGETTRAREMLLELRSELELHIETNQSAVRLLHKY